MEGNLYGVKIVSAQSGDWYSERVGDVYEVSLEKDEETGLLVYIIVDTETNRELLECNSLLNIFRDGLLTIGYEDAKIEYVK